VVLTRDGWIKRVGRLAAVESTRVREGDQVIAVVPGSTLDHVVFFTDDGTAYTMRINEVPASSGYGEPITKFFRLGDGVKVVAAVSTDSRFTPADEKAKGEVPGGPYLLVAASSGNVLRTPLSAFRLESTKVGRRFAKVDESDKIVMVQLVGEQTSVMLASRGGHIIQFSVDDVNILAGAGRGVKGIDLDDGDSCVGGVLVGGRFDKLVVETESGKTQEFGRVAIKLQNRGGQGAKPGARTKFTTVLPSQIELVNWDEVEGKVKPANGNGKPANGSPRLFDE